MNSVIHLCNNTDFELVKKLIHEFEGYSEMCSTGIIPEARNKGYGARLLKALEEKATQPVYLVCVIPSYFEKLGFEICDEYPPGIEEKLNYCTQGLPVSETYVVMKKVKNNP